MTDDRETRVRAAQAELDAARDLVARHECPLLDAAKARLAKAQAAYRAAILDYARELAGDAPPAAQRDRQARLDGYERCPACGLCRCVRSGTRYRCEACGASDDPGRGASFSKTGASADANPTAAAPSVGAPATGSPTVPSAVPPTPEPPAKPRRQRKPKAEVVHVSTAPAVAVPDRPDPWQTDRAAVAKGYWDRFLFTLNLGRVPAGAVPLIDAASAKALAARSEREFDGVTDELQRAMARLDDEAPPADGMLFAPQTPTAAGEKL